MQPFGFLLKGWDSRVSIFVWHQRLTCGHSSGTFHICSHELVAIRMMGYWYISHCLWFRVLLTRYISRLCSLCYFQLLCPLLGLSVVSFGTILSISYSLDYHICSLRENLCHNPAGSFQRYNLVHPAVEFSGQFIGFCHHHSNIIGSPSKVAIQSYSVIRLPRHSSFHSIFHSLFHFITPGVSHLQTCFRNSDCWASPVLVPSSTTGSFPDFSNGSNMPCLFSLFMQPLLMCSLSFMLVLDFMLVLFCGVMQRHVCLSSYWPAFSVSSFMFVFLLLLFLHLYSSFMYFFSYYFFLHTGLTPVCVSVHIISFLISLFMVTPDMSSICAAVYGRLPSCKSVLLLFFMQQYSRLCFFFYRLVLICNMPPWLCFSFTTSWSVPFMCKLLAVL